MDDLIYPLKWVTVKDGVVTEHEREEVFSSNWEKAFGKGYVPADRIAELEKERDGLVQDRRMIVSHATAGETDGEGMSVNEVSVRITMLRNRLWNDAKAPAEVRADRLAALLKEAARVCREILTEDSQDARAMGRVLFITEALLARLEEG
jgi:hypothetical protein